MTRCCHPIPSEDRRNPPRVQVGCLIGKNAPPSKRSPYDAGVDSGFSTSSRYSSWKRLGVKSQIDFQEAGGVPHCLPTPSISRSHPAKSLRMPTAKGGERRAKDRGLDKRHIQFNIIYIMRIYRFTGPRAASRISKRLHGGFRLEPSCDRSPT